jgi:hypothetical protein
MKEEERRDQTVKRRERGGDVRRARVVDNY